MASPDSASRAARGSRPGGRRHDPGGGLPGQQRDERQHLRARAGLPLGAPPHGPPLPLPADLAGQRDGAGVAGLPPAVRPGDGDAAHRELAQHLGHRERRAVGLRAQRRGQRAGHRRARRARRRAAAPSVTSTTSRLARTAASATSSTGPGPSTGRRRRQVEGRLVGPEGEDGRQAGQPGQRGREEGEAAGVGPLQVVDDEHGAVADGRGEQLDPAGEHERAPGLAVERHVGAVDLGQQDGQRGADARREPVGEVRVERERLPQHRARQPPGLAPLGQEGAAGEDGQRRRPGSPPPPAATCPPRRPRRAPRPRGRRAPRAAGRARRRGRRRPGRRTSARARLRRLRPYGAAVAAVRLREPALPEQRLPQPRRLRRRVDAQLVAQPDRRRSSAASAPARSPAAASACACTTAADSRSGSAATASAAYPAAVAASPSASAARAAVSSTSTRARSRRSRGARAHSA